VTAGCIGEVRGWSARFQGRKTLLSESVLIRNKRGSVRKKNLLGSVKGEGEKEKGFAALSAKERTTQFIVFRRTHSVEDCNNPFEVVKNGRRGTIGDLFFEKKGEKREDAFSVKRTRGNGWTPRCPILLPFERRELKFSLRGGRNWALD